MEQAVILPRSTKYIPLLIFTGCLCTFPASLTSVSAQTPTPLTMPTPPAKSDSSNVTPEAAESLRFVQALDNLRELPLPDEWYETKGATVAKHFEAVAAAQRKAGVVDASETALANKYSNSGYPFVHKVWLNQLFVCDVCDESSGQGFFTIASVSKNLSVVVTAGEVHGARLHHVPFSAEKRDLLRALLSAP